MAEMAEVAVMTGMEAMTEAEAMTGMEDDIRKVKKSIMATRLT
jgi:hypothetical protein